MEPREFRPGQQKHLRKGVGGYWAFVPPPLSHQIEYGAEVGSYLSLADQKLGSLRGLCYRLQAPNLLSGAYVNREAVLSSRIEGTKSTGSDLYLFEIEPASTADQQDVLEVQNYVTALNYALKRRETLPLCLKLLREIHERLVTGVRGSIKSPGEFRTSQNWIGGASPSNASHVPPPVEEMRGCLDALEKFLHRPSPKGIPALIECALVHYQFEAIHPFLDGNGRVGRLLITLLTIERECLDAPLLYLSAYFERNRSDYYDRLSEVSRTGDWRSWLIYFLIGVAEQAKDAIARSQTIVQLRESYLDMKLSPTAHRLVDRLFLNPYITVKFTSNVLSVSVPTANLALRQLESAGIVSPIDPSRRRGQIYVAQDILHAYTADPNA